MQLASMVGERWWVDEEGQGGLQCATECATRFLLYRCAKP